MGSLRLTLTLTSPDNVYTHTTNENVVKIGRTSKCDFVIDREDISREHCLFKVENDAYYITDLGSKNGVSVDGSKLPAHTSREVTRESSIVLSNVYVMKINPLEVKTRADIVLQKVSPEVKTSTSLDVQESPTRRKSGKKYKIVATNSEKETPSNHYDSIKMILGFLAVVALIIYQALGR